MSEREIKNSGIESLDIARTKHGNDAMKRAVENNEKDDGPQVCQRVETGKKIPTHERRNELQYRYTAAENLKESIYWCIADLKEFDERYEDEKTK